MITLPIIGAASWGNPLNSSLQRLAASGFNPDDYALSDYNYDPSEMTAGAAPVSGTVRLIRLPFVTTTHTITSIALHVTTAAVSGTAGRNWVGLYDGGGTRLAQSADATTVFSSAGPKVIPLGAPYVASLGRVYVAVLATASTMPQFGVRSTPFTAAAANWNLPVTVLRYGDGPTGQLTLPATIDMGTLTASAQTTWAGTA